MARLVFPEDRFVYRLTGIAFSGVPGVAAVLYTDIAATILADVRVYDGTVTPGAAYAGSTVTTDAYSRLPLFWGPDGVDTLYTVIAGGPVTALYARVDDRFDTLGGGVGGPVTSVETRTGVVTLSDLYQPLDSDLTAIAALTTTAYGRAFLALADAAAARTALALGTAATSATTAFDAAGLAAAAQAASQPLDSDLTAIAALATTSFGRSRLTEADAGAARAALALGTTVTKTSAYTLVTGTDMVVLANATSAGFTLTLPTAVGFSAMFVIDAITTNTNLVTVATTSAQTIDGAATLTLGPASSGAPYRSVTLVSDGANWRVV